MKLFFLIICLIIVFSTLEILIVSGFHAKRYRLMPLMLGLVALYDFYLIVEHITGQTAAFQILKDLLLVQILAVSFYFIMDFLKLRLRLIPNLAIVVTLVLMDILIITMAAREMNYRIYVVIVSILAALAIIVFVVVRAPKWQMISHQERVNNHTMGLAIMIIAVSILLAEVRLIEPGIILPLAADISCLMIDVLFITDSLKDVDSLLKEQNFRHLDVAAFLMDNDFFFLDASKKARELFPREIAAISASPRDNLLQDFVWKLQTEGGVSYRDIEGKYMRCRVQEVRHKGKRYGYILTFTDVTNEKNETDTARELAKQKSDFLASMSHDLRSPLHAIIGSSEVVLTKGGMPSKSKVMVNYIHEAGKNLLDIVNSILDFSKLESGELKLFPQEYNFKHLVEEQARLGFLSLKDSKVQFTFEVVNEYPESLYGDRMRVRQIIQNLVSNAIKFTEKGYVHCSLSVGPEKNKEVLVTCTVSDTGVGMTREQMDSVFEDYVSYAQEKKQEGTGLGLSIVKKLSEMMGGGVTVESTEHVGSTFTVTFYQKTVQTEEKGSQSERLMPLKLQDENDIEDTSIWKNEVRPTYTYGKAQVLLVDDMAVNREIFKSLAEPWKFRPDMAEDGSTALKMAAEKKYDLIFLDQMMPGMSGLETADKMHEAGIDTPMVLLSANITESLKEASNEHGFRAFMNKPIDLVQLRTCIESCLPKELREEADNTPVNMASPENTADTGFMKALKTYTDEMESLYALLPEYEENDLAMFRNKVHGIKGVSRQLGFTTIADAAEVMEMAAISEHRDYIKRYFEAFMEELQFTIEDCKNRLGRLTKNQAEGDDDSAEDGGIVRKQATLEEINELFSKMKQALTDYEMSDVDAAIEALDGISLPEEVKTRYEKAKAAYEDMEYEEALAALGT